MVHRIYFSICALLAAAIVAGCESADEPVVDATPAVASAPAVEKPPATPAAKPDKSPEEAEPVPESRAVVAYSPPFPDRQDLFEPPKRSQSSVRRDDAGETVELKGFVNVDEPRVVLAIDGVISGISEGGEKYGVQVISIQPPTVVLQRGRNRWTATLE